MGVPLADILNPATETEVCPGVKIKIRSLGIGKIFEILVSELRKLATAKTGAELNDEAQKCLETGRIPWSAVEELIWAGVEAAGQQAIGRPDVAALVTMQNMKLALDLVALACGFKESKKNEVAPEAAGKPSP